jgi:hypothetical protein
VHAGRTFHEHSPIERGASVEIIGVSGSIDLSGWDQPEVDVTGDAGGGVDRVEVTTSPSRVTVRILPHGSSEHESHFTIRVPGKSPLTVSLVSGDLKLTNVLGDVVLQTVNGDILGEVGGNLQARTVSGSVRLAAPAAHRIEVKTASGDIDLAGGGGDVEISTISGDAKLHFGPVERGRFHSISGDFTTELALAAGGQIEGNSVSGSMTLNFAGIPGADFDVQTLSGDISNCFGPKPVQPRYGPGSRLTFTSGDGHGHVHFDTKSGEVHLCARDLRAQRLASERKAGIFPLF